MQWRKASTPRRPVHNVRGVQSFRAQMEKRRAIESTPRCCDQFMTAHITRTSSTAQLLQCQNGSDQRERANDLQADEKTDYPFSVASHGSVAAGFAQH
jgi:hypothetical protein